MIGTSIFFSPNEKTLAGSWMGDGHYKDQIMIRNLELLALYPFSRGETGARDGINNHAYMMKPHKNPVLQNCLRYGKITHLV